MVVRTCKQCGVLYDEEYAECFLVPNEMRGEFKKCPACGFCIIDQVVYDLYTKEADDFFGQFNEDWEIE